MSAVVQTTQIPGGRPAFKREPTVFGETLILDGTSLDVNVAEAIIAGGAVLTRTMDGAESIELTLADPDMDILDSGLLTRRGKASSRQKQLAEAAWGRYTAMRLALDGVYFRFAGVQFNYDSLPWTLTLTFESEVATLMRLKDAPLKSSRGTTMGHSTRAGFILRLATLSQPKGLIDRDILSFRFYGPDIDNLGAIAQPTDADRKKGLSASAHLTVKGQLIDAEQRKHATIALTEADVRGANERVTLAMLVAAIGESEIRPVPNRIGSGYEGVFQANPRNIPRTDTKQQAKYFLIGGKGFQQGGAIKLAAANPDMSPGSIAYKVEGSRANFGSDALAEAHYQQHIDEAEQILEAWGGASKTVTLRESYEYRAGQKDSNGKRENYWDASGRLCDERRWRRFATRNALWIGPDEWFFKNTPVFVIDGKKTKGQSRRAVLASQGILGITGNADIGMPTAELQVRALAPRWTASPGTVFEFTNLAALTGRWLIWENRLDLTQGVEIAELTLRRPAPQKKEPAPGTRTVTTSTADGDVTADGLKAICQKFTGTYLWGGGHGPALTSLKVTDNLDCSSSTSLALFKAGLWDGRATARVSGEFASWGEEGQGDDFTVWYSAEHVFVQAKAWRFDTGGPGGGAGPRYRAQIRPTAGFKARHWEAE